MHLELKEHLNKALKEYTSGIHYETLIEAKNEYFGLTGQVNDDDEDYELRMNSFNDWYVLQFISKRATHTVIKDYLIRNQIDNEIGQGLTNVNHSLFEYIKEGSRGDIILKDILHDCKCVLAADPHGPIMLKSDIFLGRVLSYQKKNYLLNGISILPREVRSILKKKCKKVRKLKDSSKELEFLLKMESMRTKWIRYGYIGANSIFAREAV